MNKPRYRHDVKISPDATKKEIEEFVTEFKNQRQITAPTITSNSEGNLILTPEEQDSMRVAGTFNAQLMDHVRTLIGSGTILEDFLHHNYSIKHLIRDRGAYDYETIVCRTISLFIYI